MSRPPVPPLLPLDPPPPVRELLPTLWIDRVGLCRYHDDGHDDAVSGDEPNVEGVAPAPDVAECGGVGSRRCAMMREAPEGDEKVVDDKRVEEDDDTGEPLEEGDAAVAAATASLG